MTANQIRQIVALAKAGSFRHAATALKISQPTLSRAVASLEKELGVPLFDRLPRGVALTEFGCRFVEYGRTFIAAEDDLFHDLALIAGLEIGSVSVALSPYSSMVSGYPAAGRLLRSHPKLSVDLRVPHFRDGVRAVLEREVELGFTELAEASGNDALSTELVGEHIARFFCRPDHPILAIPAAGRLGGGTCSRFPGRRHGCRRGSARTSGGLRAGRERSTRPRRLHPRHPARGADADREFRVRTDALIVAGYGLVEPELRAGALAVVPLENLGFRAGYGFIWLRHRTRSPATLAYMDAVREEERAFAKREAELAVLYQHGTRRGARF